MIPVSLEPLTDTTGLAVHPFWMICGPNGMSSGISVLQNSGPQLLVGQLRCCKTREQGEIAPFPQQVTLQLEIPNHSTNSLSPGVSLPPPPAQGSSVTANSSSLGPGKCGCMASCADQASAAVFIPALLPTRVVMLEGLRSGRLCPGSSAVVQPSQDGVTHTFEK